MNRGAKIQAAKASKKADRDKQSIQFENTGLELYRADEFNWCLKFKGQKDPWYYGRLIHALKEIPHKLLNKGELHALDDILKKQSEIEHQINMLYSLKIDQ